MTNAERIEVLRYCGADKGCLGCQLDGIALTDCFLQVMIDAADALEAADNRIAELEAARMELTTKCRRLQAQMQTVTDCHTLEEENDEQTD